MPLAPPLTGSFEGGELDRCSDVSPVSTAETMEIRAPDPDVCLGSMGRLISRRVVVEAESPVGSSSRGGCIYQLRTLAHQCYLWLASLLTVCLAACFSDVLFVWEVLVAYFSRREEPREVCDWFSYHNLTVGVRPEVADKKDSRRSVFMAVDAVNSNLRVSEMSNFLQPYRLSAEQATAVLAAIGEATSTVVISGVYREHSHPALAIVRGYAYKLALRVLHGMRVLDVGGSTARLCGQLGSAVPPFNVHCCSPTVDTADARRRLSHRLNTTSRCVVVRDGCYFDPEGITACTHVYGECCADPEALLFVDTIYYVGERAVLDGLRAGARMAIVLYHCLTRSFDRYFGEARVTVTRKAGKSWVQMWVPGNDEPYEHEAINISSDRVFSFYLSGRKIYRRVVAKWMDYHMVIYTWGPDIPVASIVLPTAGLRDLQGPDRRGLMAAAGITTKADYNTVQVHKVYLIDKPHYLNRVGSVLCPVRDSLVKSFLHRTRICGGFDDLYELMLQAYADHVLRVQVSDVTAVEHAVATSFAAACRVVELRVGPPRIVWGCELLSRSWRGVTREVGVLWILSLAILFLMRAKLSLEYAAISLLRVIAVFCVGRATLGVSEFLPFAMCICLSACGLWEDLRDLALASSLVLRQAARLLYWPTRREVLNVAEYRRWATFHEEHLFRVPT